MTEEQRLRFYELQDQVFQFINSIDDDTDRMICAIDIVCQAITGGEHYFDEHKFILNEAGKLYRKSRKEIMIEEGTWDKMQEEIIKKNQYL
jgi:hypothetical protein